VALILPEGVEKRRVVEGMFDRIAPRYDLLNELISLGAHRRWKRAAVASLGCSRGTRVLDLACGTGDLLDELARAGLRGVGVDVSSGMLQAARRRRVSGGLLRASADALPFADASIEGVVCGFALRNFVAIEPVLREVARVLEPGARVAFVEVDRPLPGPLGAVQRIYLERLVPFVGALLSDGWAYRYLPSSVAYLPSDEVLRDMLEAAGFADVEKHRLMLGSAQLVVARRRSA